MGGLKTKETKILLGKVGAHVVPADVGCDTDQGSWPSPINRN